MRAKLMLAAWLIAGGVGAQDLTVYDDALRNDFVPGYSYSGAINLASTDTVRNGTASIAFSSTGNGAVAFANEARTFDTSQYAGLRFHVHGGNVGGHQLSLHVYSGLGGVPDRVVELDSFIAGGGVAANEWRAVEVRFAQLPQPFAGAFKRLDVQVEGAGLQPVLHLDDVALISAQTRIFTDSFEGDAVAPPAGELRFTRAMFRAAEDGGNAAITVQRVNGSAGVVSVDIATSDASATAPDDYSASTATLTWADGESVDKLLLVPLVPDALSEQDEIVALTLSNPTGGASLVMPSTATLTIVEPELLFVPQFTLGGTGSIRVYRRGAGGFLFANVAALPANTNPNAVAFAPDGKLWVVDGGNPNRLLRYDIETVALLPNPVPEVVITPVGNASGDYFDLAFFGDFAYVSQSDFGATHRILKLPLTSLAASGSPMPVLLSNASLNVPAGLEFDAQGRLWVSNFSGQTLVRMSTDTGVADRVGNSVNMGARASLSNPEGLAFDAAGTLWVGNNGAPTIAGYSAAQLDDAGFNAITPAHFIDIEPGVTAPGNGHTGFVGGLAFEREDDLWVNYQRAFAVIEYDEPAIGAPGQTLANATTDPGFGGLAFWPVPATVQRGMPGAAPIEFRGTTLVGMEAPFTTFDLGTGPAQDTHYPRFDEKLIDYFAGKGMSALRILVGWEALQSQLMGPIPAAANGNYKTYFDNYTRIVDYATNMKGMTVLITPWQFDDNVNGQGFSGVGGPTWRGGRVDTEVPMAAWSDFWTKLAGHFKDNPRVQYVLVTEPNNMSTMQWFQIAQAGVTAIRASGSTQRIHVPGNGYSAASTWDIGNAFYDTAATKRSNAYGWLNANGAGQPISDPLNNLAVEVHSYVDNDQGGVTDQITSITALRNQLANTVNWARANGLRVYLGETGMHATTPVTAGGTAQQAWDDFIAYFEANADTLEGFTWWAGGDPRGWWTDQGANGGGHYAISPLRPNSYVDPDVSYSGDTVNMDMIENDF
jgi:endoglucanase